MKFLKQGVCLGLLVAGLAVVPTIQAQAGAPAPAAPDSLVDRIRAEADGTVRISQETATGKVGFVRATDDLLPSRGADSAASAAAKADAYLAEYGAAFGAGEGQLVRDGVTANAHGWTVTYVQRYRGLSVFGAMVRANLDEAGNLTAVNGYAAPDLDLSVDPARSTGQATEAAVAAVRAEPPGGDGEADLSGIKATSHELVVYREGLVRGDVGDALLAYEIEVSNGANIRDVVFVDANTGKLVNRYSLVHDALKRRLHEGSVTNPPVWVEGQPLPGGLNENQLNTVLGAGESYWFFQNAFGRDSYDDLGGEMVSVNNRPADCPNASWNGQYTSYCNDVTADDVVAHEWGHAYTEFTWDGIYQWQPGALNEAYSDIWGETVDLINGRMDAGEVLTKRTAGLCSQHTAALPRLIINAPASVAKICSAGAAAYGPQVTEAGTTSDIVLAQDGVDSATDACTPLTNAAAIAGRIGLADRGSCSFKLKSLHIQQAGGIGAVIGNNTGTSPLPLGDDPTVTDPITIPSIGISRADRDRIVSGLATSAVNVTMKDVTTAAKDPSHRWLIGEDATAFNPSNPAQASIRDMWMPTCNGHPGKVSDAEYHCDTSDAGGVHRNSGVPNHAYALLVDGGSYNGVTVTGIGLDKAAAIYFRAMEQYQTPTSDFSDHADALTASCADLVDQPISTLTVDPNASPTAAPPVAAEDCTQVASVIAAVELRQEPVQCNFQPLLTPGAPPQSCGTGFTTGTVYSEDFEDGLAGWEQEGQIVFPGGFSSPWEADTTAPGDHPGAVARGVADGGGDCTNSAGDNSSVDSITSPTIALPAAAQAPRMTFDHYIATELNYDGGNVKVSVNGGPFTVIPTSAYTFNPPNVTLQATNPLEGQPGFSGTDGGEVTGTWGQSQVDLAALGVTFSDQVRFRFDMGRDGCGGIDGWYVDNVTVQACTPKGTPPVPPGRKASRTVLKVGDKTPDFRQDFTAKAKVTAEDVVLSGRVRFLADGQKVGTGRLTGQGKAAIKVTKNLRPGKYKIVARYLGSTAVERSKDKVRIRIKR